MYMPDTPTDESDCIESDGICMSRQSSFEGATAGLTQTEMTTYQQGVDGVKLTERL